MSPSTETTDRVAIAVAMTITAPAYAKRVAGYLPPPYLDRFGCSLFTLTMLASPILFVLVLTAAASGANARTRILRTVVVAAACVIAGAAIAALDGRNDELWNPVFYGTPFITASLPIGIFQALPRENPSRVSATIVAALFTPFIGGIFYLAGTGLAAHLFMRGWPTSW